VNVEATTVVVTAFLAGLGGGSLIGGWLADADDAALLRRFGGLEFTIGVFGVVSLPFFRWIGDITVLLAPVPRGVVMALIVMLPTTLMGATLPLLVAYAVRGTRNVGQAVGMLYFVNTAGSALAAFAAVLVVLRLLGETRSTLLAAAVNLSVAGFVLVRPRLIGGVGR
jgi:predicted membrane-bound spermidine synthase